MTPIEQKMFKLLSDGMFHTRTEVHSCLYDELGKLSNIKHHISTLRKKLPLGYLIVCVNRGKLGYQMVRSISSANTGRV